MIKRLLLACLMCCAATAAQAACAEMERRPWTQAAEYGLSVEVHAIGPACATAAIVLLVTNKSDDVRYSFIREAKTMMWFQDGVGDGAAMKLGLKNWLDAALDNNPTSTRELPDWKVGAVEPEREGDGEFGFFSENLTDRDSYLATRAAGHPMFCFVSGLESTTCLYASDAKTVTEIGGFSFPG